MALDLSLTLTLAPTVHYHYHHHPNPPLDSIRYPSASDGRIDTDVEADHHDESTDGVGTRLKLE